jgi:dienelactone hydrolase
MLFIVLPFLSCFTLNGQAVALEADTEMEIVDIYNAVQPNESERAGDIRTEYKELCYSYLTLDEMTVLSVYKNDGASGPLLVFLNGLGLEKESLLPILSAYAEAGYYVASIDAYDQGERTSNEIYCDMWAAVLITVRDVDRVIDYFEDVPGIDTDNFALGGFSMGGVETCVYAERGEHTPAALLVFSGVCEYDAWQQDVRSKLTYMWLKPWKSSVWAFPERQTPAYSLDKYKLIRSMDITANLEHFNSIPIFIGIGEGDTYFYPETIETVAETIQDSGNETVNFTVYADTGHELTEDMVQDSVIFLSKII